MFTHDPLCGVETLLTMDTAPMIAARGAVVALVPVGAYEQHGPHLPVTTDTLIACAIAQRVCVLRPALRVAPLGVSCSQEHAGFAGCIALSSETLASVIRDVVEWAGRGGSVLTVLVNAHGGNYVLGNLVQQLNVDRPTVLIGPSRAHWEAAAGEAGIETPLEHDMHAGEIETSILLHVLPGAVRTSAVADVAGDTPRDLPFYAMRHYSPGGVIGSPSLASAAKGRVLLQSLASQLDAHIQAALAHQSGAVHGDAS